MAIRKIVIEKALIHSNRKSVIHIGLNSRIYDIENNI